MIRLGVLAIFFIASCNLALAQQYAPDPAVNAAPTQVPPQQMQPPQQPFPGQQMPNEGGTGMPDQPTILPDNPPGFPPVGLPPPPEETIAKPAEGLSARDPFRLPEALVIKIRQKNAVTVTAASSGGIDPSVEAIRRFPLGSYQLVGIIWDVKRPKAMFMDVSRSIHVLQINDFIGNAKGVITSIQSGSVTVLEGKIPQIIKLKK